MHLDDARIQKLLDRELGDRDEGLARTHLDECIACSRRAEDARRDGLEIASLLETLDGPMPRVDPRTIIARADSAPEAHDRFAGLRRAAAVLLAIGIAGAVYAIPGSPVRTWIRDAVRTMSPKPPSNRAPLPQEAGISILPEDRLVILFHLGGARGDGLASLSMTDGAEVQVHAPPGAAAFASSPGRLEIEVRDVSAPILIQIPRSAPWIEIRSDGESVFLKEGARIITTAPSEPRDGYTLRLERRNPAP